MRLERTNAAAAILPCGPGPTLRGWRPAAPREDRPVWADAAEMTAAKERPARTVLVPVDGTPFGEHAVPVAAEVARRVGAALRVVQVFSPGEAAAAGERLMTDPRWVLDERRRREEYLSGLVRRVARLHPLAVTGTVVGGDVAGAVGEAAAPADLVVMVTRGRGAWGRFWRGSVSAAVIRRARCPVLLVRGRDEPPDLTGWRLPGDILVPLDGTPRAEEAARAAVSLGSLWGARHHLLHLIRGWAFSPFGSADLTPLPGEIPAADARGYLRGVAARIAGPGATVTKDVVTDDRPPAEAIAGYAERIGADLVALATRGRGLLSRLVRPSLAADLVHRLNVPVLLTGPGTTSPHR